MKSAIITVYALVIGLGLVAFITNKSPVLLTPMPWEGYPKPSLLKDYHPNPMVLCTIFCG